MRIGLILETRGSIDEVVDRARGLAATGATSLWSTQIFGWDTLTALAIVGREVPGVELGTAVIPIHPRHPAILAAQAATVQAATGGRLVLGVGLSHQVVVEGVWGLSYEHPARYMKEYLSVLVPLLRGEPVDFEGELLQTHMGGPLETVGVPPPVVLVAALGSAMLGIAGRQACGTVTWMVGLKTLADHVVPTINAAAAEAGRPAPRIVVNLPVCVTADPESALQLCGEFFAVYGQLPSYRAMLDREGAVGPPDVAIVGGEEGVAAAIAHLAEAGATEFCGAAFGTKEEVSRTQELLGELTAS
jgi:F420-dependent oxidoreductase-like protein